MTAFVDRLMKVCETEWMFFGQSSIRTDGKITVGMREYDDGAWQRIADYWRLIGGPYKHLTGKDRGTPWSAAFISWCMNEAGDGDKFPYSPGHATYINAAIKNVGQAGAPLVAHPPKSYSLKPGDLIGYWRGVRAINLDNALQVGWYQSHTDIVVEVGNGFARTIGGNLMHSVTKREVKLSAVGELIDRRENWFVSIANNI